MALCRKADRGIAASSLSLQRIAKAPGHSGSFTNICWVNDEVRQVVSQPPSTSHCYFPLPVPGHLHQYEPLLPPPGWNLYCRVIHSSQWQEDSFSLGLSQDSIVFLVARSPFFGSLLCGLKMQVWIGRLRWFCKLVWGRQVQEFPRILSVVWQRTWVSWAGNLAPGDSGWNQDHLQPCRCWLLQHVPPCSWLSLISLGKISSWFLLLSNVSSASLAPLCSLRPEKDNLWLRCVIHLEGPKWFFFFFQRGWVHWDLKI